MLRVKAKPVNPHEHTTLSTTATFALAHRSCLKMVRPERFELPTTKFVAWYSIQLSYGRTEKTFHFAAAMSGHRGGEARSGIIQTPPPCVNPFLEKYSRRLTTQQKSRTGYDMPTTCKTCDLCDDITDANEKGGQWPPFIKLLHGATATAVQTQISFPDQCDSAAPDRPPCLRSNPYRPLAVAAVVSPRLVRSWSSQPVVRAHARP